MTKITISPADLRQIQDALSRLSAASQWADIAESLDIDVSEIRKRIDANRKCCEGGLELMERYQGTVI